MNDMAYEVVISDRAKLMLGSHIKFLATVNKHSAKELKENIISEISSLSEMPHRFPFFNEKYIMPNKYHMLYIKKFYLVISQIKDNAVYVDYILDCRQDYAWLLK